MHIGKTLSPVVAFSSSSQRSLRYAVLGAGFAGLSVAWHLLEHSPIELRVCIDVLDEVGIGGGASGVAGGLLHPYSPKVKPLWRAAECWEESLRLLSIAETALHSKEMGLNNKELNQSSVGVIVRRRGILRPAVSLKNMSVINDNAQNYLASCRIQSIDEDAARSLVPNICVPSNSAFYMPDAVNVHPLGYLEQSNAHFHTSCNTTNQLRPYM